MRGRFITNHVTFKPAYDYKFQLKMSLVSLLTKLLTDNIFVNGPVFKCPFTKITKSVNNLIIKLTNTL